MFAYDNDETVMLDEYVFLSDRYAFFWLAVICLVNHDDAALSFFSFYIKSMFSLSLNHVTSFVYILVWLFCRQINLSRDFIVYILLFPGLQKNI